MGGRLSVFGNSEPCVFNCRPSCRAPAGREQGHVGRAVSSFELNVADQNQVQEKFTRPGFGGQKAVQRSSSVTSLSGRPDLGRSLTRTLSEMGDSSGKAAASTRASAPAYFSKAELGDVFLQDTQRHYVGQLSDGQHCPRMTADGTSKKLKKSDAPEPPTRKGFGIQVWGDGARYEGQWADDAAHGLGRFTFPAGHTYIGEWRGGKSNGLGTWTSSDGQVSYAGEWHEDRQHGLGIESWDGGDATFTGKFQAGIKQGHGVYERGSGTYSGGWSKNNMHGAGQYATNSAEISGRWQSGRLSGPTRGFWRDEMHTYEGQCTGDSFEGFGVIYWGDGARYEGFWLNGSMHGAGMWVEPNGCKALHQWNMGQLCESGRG